MSKKTYANIIKHYESCLEKYGDNHLGVDWPKKEDVDTRHRVMHELLRFSDVDHLPQKVSLLDFGCGASHFYDYLKRNKVDNIDYSGLDISQKFIDLSKKKFPQNKYYCIDIIERKDDLPDFDFVVMNGVFTEKINLSFEEMFQYFKSLLAMVYSKAKIGLAFNVMSKAVEWEREDLFHLSTDLLIDFFTKNLSRNFIIRNDYGLYEYTAYLYR